MRVARLLLLLVLPLALVGLHAVVQPARAAAATWRPPVDGDVLTAFAYGGDRFDRGHHRGVDLAARPGQAVRAPCSGEVTFAGRVPRHGRAVTTRCGALAATVLGLSAVRVRRGGRVRRGAMIGRARGDHVHLGARRRGDRFGYVDPLGLLAAPTQPAPLGPAPAARRTPRPPDPAPAAPAVRPARAPAPHARPVPPLAWAALGLIAAGLPAAALQRRRRRPPAGRLTAHPAR